MTELLLLCDGCELRIRYEHHIDGLRLSKHAARTHAEETGHPIRVFMANELIRIRPQNNRSNRAAQGKPDGSETGR